MYARQGIQANIDNSNQWPCHRATKLIEDHPPSLAGNATSQLLLNLIQIHNHRCARQRQKKVVSQSICEGRWSPITQFVYSFLHLSAWTSQTVYVFAALEITTDPCNLSHSCFVAAFNA